jgi:hypothetical protein
VQLQWWGRDNVGCVIVAVVDRVSHLDMLLCGQQMSINNKIAVPAAAAATTKQAIPPEKKGFALPFAKMNLSKGTVR